MIGFLDLNDQKLGVSSGLTIQHGDLSDCTIPKCGFIVDDTLW
jgi:hypothetical protein